MEMGFGRKGDALLVNVNGRLDALGAPEFDSQIQTQLNGGGKKFVLDFSELQYISSAGLRSVLMLAKKVQSLGGGLSLYGLQPVVREVFQISGFDTILSICNTQEEALEKTGLAI